MSRDISTMLTKTVWRLSLLLVTTLEIFTANSKAQNFAPTVDFPTQSQPLGIAKADFNNDGNIDVVVANSGSQSLSLFLGKGDGTFAPATSITLTPVRPVTVVEPPQPVSVATGDFNGDGKQDIAVGFTNTTVTVQILFGNGDGTFSAGINQSQVSNIVDNFQLTVGDFNEDGNPDIAAATDGGILILLNDGSGTLTPTTTQPFSGGFTTHFATGDINGDRHLDVVAILGDGSVQETLGSGDGTFRTPTNIPFPPSSTVPAGGSIALGDFNLDGRPDLVFVEFGNASTGAPGAIHVNLQRLDGTFSAAQVTLTPTFHPTSVLVGDFNGDGQTDIAVLSGNVPSDPNAVVVYLGQGILKFGPPTFFDVSLFPDILLSANLTNTPALDLITTDLNANSISVVVNHGADSLSLSSSLNPSVVTQPVTLTATVQPKFSESGNLSGSIVFSDGSSILGTSPVNSSGSASVTAKFFNAGNHPVLATFGGNSSFVGSSATITQVVNKAPASITLNSSINPSSFGQSVIFSVAVTGAPGGPTPTGAVNLLDGNSIVLSAVLDNTGKATLSTSFLAVGNHLLTAQYAGDTNNASANSSLAQTVNKNASSTTLASSPNPSVFGQAITLTATVTGPAGTSGTPTGTVTFNDGTNAIGTSNLDSTGRATLSTSSLTVGTHSISAAYAGDANFSGSAAANVSQAVNKAATTNALTASPNPSTFGQSVTLTAAVIAQAGSGIPTGTMTFADGTTDVGSATVDKTGKAALSVGTLSVGPHSLTASYSGDGNFLSSTSSPVSQIVSKISTTTSLTASPNPSVLGQPVVFTATVAASGSGAGTPAGSVTFVDGAATIGTAVLDKTGKATFTVSSLSVGTHNIGANYGGDGNFNSSSASGTAGVNQVVGQSNTVTAISSSADPSIYGQAITLTASVTASGGGGGMPSGSVTFLDGAVVIGTAPLDANGNAPLTISSLGVGVHNITASYPGTGGYLPSGSGNLSQTVDKDSVSVVLTSVPNPSTFGQAVTFTVKVVPRPPGGAPGTAVPSGTITFSDGVSALGSAVLDNTGTATLTISTLTAGSHTIAGSYGGDTSFSKGSSGPALQTVNQVTTTTLLATSINPATSGSTITLTATVRANVGSPTGNVTFLDGLGQLGSSQVDGTGNAVLSVSSLSPGTHMLIAAYRGDSNFASSQSPPVTETVLDSRSILALTSSANPQTVTKAISFSATVTTATGGPVNSGVVSFTNGATVLATISVTNSAASFTTKNLPVGNDVITAAYQAGPSPGPSDGSATLVETINPATPIVVGGGNDQDFTFSLNPGQAQIKAGSTVTAQVILTPLNGLTGVVNISCDGIPPGSSCALKPNTTTFDGKSAIRASLVITTSGPGAPPRRPHPPRRRKEEIAWLSILPIAFGCILIPALQKKRAGLLAITVLAAMLPGCGGSIFETVPLNSNTPAGNYTIVAQAVAGPLVHSAQIRLSVK